MKTTPGPANNGGDSAMAELTRLAEMATQTRGDLDVALEADRCRWPKTEFQRLVNAVAKYAAATEGSALIHRSVAASVAGLREYLELMGKRVPGAALAEADRLEVILFCGYDPRFDGFEPPGL